MLQNPCKTLGFKKNMVYKIPPGGGGKPYPASGLLNFLRLTSCQYVISVTQTSVNKQLYWMVLTLVGSHSAYVVVALIDLFMKV